MLLFRKVEPPPFGPGGKKPPHQTVPNWGRIIAAFVLLVVIVGLAFYARNVGWDSAADRFLDLAKVGGGMLFGTLLAEKSASK